MIDFTNAERTPATRERRRPSLTHRVLLSDQRVAYFLFVPEVRSDEPRLVVSVHGANRNVDVHARLLSAYAEMYGAVLLVPHFSKSRYEDYQRLGRNGRGKRADLALHRMLREVGTTVGMPADRIHLFGFAAGAQFVHRYAMAYPHRVVSAVLANASRYTLPDAKQRFPRGIRSNPKFPGLRFDPDAFLGVPMTLFLGAPDPEDKVVTLPRREPGPAADRRARRTERAREWVAAMQQLSKKRRIKSAITCEELPDRIRSFRSSVLRAGLAERAFEAMFGPPPIERAIPEAELSAPPDPSRPEP
jgi:poly(3-hydroxybutyrate) depolymerase